MELRKKPFSKNALLFNKADRAERKICQRLNQIGASKNIRLFFRTISRLGDGAFWYGLMLLLPLLFGMEGLTMLGHIVIAGLVCVACYSQLKSRLVRQRPYISWQDIHAHTAPLDLYSFPSGHTMNAVNFTVLFGYFYPPLLWLVMPFTILVALSRVILGMHYPTDVLVGALLGATIASISLVIWPAGMFVIAY